ncbi:MAG TPA: hypothetical protein VGG03_22150 [Thermoanaerobaculia bacterium]|jgi:hypothetical protein
MSRSLARVGLLLLAVALLAAPASADVFYVTLTNGTVIESAHQPQQASWDPNMVLLLTEVGNWVGFPKDEVESIRAEDPTQGFGVRISDHAIALGWSPNDLPEDTARSAQEQLNDRLLQLTERMLQRAEGQQNYSVQQFVEPNQTQGIPTSVGGYFEGVGSPGFGNLPVGPPVLEPGSMSGNEINPPQ